MRISLAEEIREISQVAPKDFDPDELHFEPEIQNDDQAVATEHYLLELGYLFLFQFFHLFLTPPSQSFRPPQDAGQLVGSQILWKTCVENTAAWW